MCAVVVSNDRANGTARFWQARADLMAELDDALRLHLQL
jgi:mRNA-degrading endonuclease toxin of MazEF toxin-antitoxin module